MLSGRRCPVLFADHLGIDPAPTTYEQPPWWQQQGPTVFSPFPADSDDFGSPEQAWMLNLRVRDLDAMVAQLRAAAIEVTVDPQTYPNGRFASTADPEGNPIQLWEHTRRAPGATPPPLTPRPTRPAETTSSVAWCSASIWSAPDGSGLLRLGASSIQTDPDGPRRIVWMIKQMIKPPGDATRPAAVCRGRRSPVGRAVRVAVR
jgi:glyoxylase I family protein